MCTVSILSAAEPGGGYDLWFNRDEQRTRAPESAPVAAVTACGMEYVAPRDGARGGTWLVLNRAGLTVVVLNDYEAGGAAACGMSRGSVPLAGVGATNVEEALGAVRVWVDKAGAANFGPFLVVAVDAKGRSGGLRWGGAGWSAWAGADFATSSSFAPGRTRVAREAAYAEVARAGLTRRSLEEWHWRHEAGRAAESVRMSRADACTRSVCRVEVRAGAGPRLVYRAVDWSVADGRGAATEAGW